VNEIRPGEVAGRLAQIRERRRALADARQVRVVDRFGAERTRGQRVADSFASVVGSWPFIIGQTAVLFAWIILNVVAWLRHWDPYPFILLNLMLSFQAAYAGPIIMMSQNRAAELDRLQAQADYRVNEKAELEIEEIMLLLDAHTRLLDSLLARVSATAAPTGAPE